MTWGGHSTPGRRPDHRMPIPCGDWYAACTLNREAFEMSIAIRNVRFSIIWIIVGVAAIPAAVLGVLFLAERIMRWHFYPGI
jgi:hypothetical protein